MNVKTKTHNLYKMIFVLVVFLGIGYAFLEANLNINGDVTVEAPEFNTYVQSVSKTTGSTTGTPTIIGNDKKEVDFTTSLTSDGSSFFEETTTVINKGSKKASLQSIDVKVYDSSNNEVTLSVPYEYSLTHGDGTSITPGEELASAATTTYKLKFNYISSTDMNTVTDYPTYTFKITYNFTKNSFANDSWSTIATNVTADPSAYPLGATKTIEMDLDGDNTNETYMLRVVNNTTPAECSTTGFSQSACGFVVEFSDIIENRLMNSSWTTADFNGDGNYGGWEYCEIRDYVNNTVYNKLPSNLKSKIINTTVVSGHGYLQTDNFVTTDKLYLLGTKEVWGNNSRYDSATSLTRQLDYYHNIGVTETNYSEAMKSDDWWLRSADSDTVEFFHSVYEDGSPSGASVVTGFGVSPAFRIGNQQ